MGKSLVTGLLLIFSIVASSKSPINGISFSSGNWDEIKNEARNKNKLIFLDCYTSWCGPCKNMDKTTFKDDNVGNFFNEKFINYKLNMEEGEGVNLAKEYFVGAYPTFLWLDYEGNVVHRVVGYMKAEAFLSEAEKAIEGGNFNAKLEVKYNRNKSNPKIVKSYLDYLIETADYRAEEVSRQYLSIISDEEYDSPYVFDLLTSQISIPDNSVFKFFLDNQQKFKNKFGEAKVKLMLSNIFHRYSRKISSATSPEKPMNHEDFENFKTLMNRADYSDHYRLEEKTILNVLINRSKWTEYVERVNKLRKNHKYGEVKFMDFRNWYEPILESECTNQKVLEQTLIWIEKAINLNSIFKMSYLKKDWEAKVKILERMHNKNDLLHKSKIELSLINMLEVKEEQALKLREKRKQELELLFKENS